MQKSIKKNNGYNFFSIKQYYKFTVWLTMYILQTLQAIEKVMHPIKNFKLSVWCFENEMTQGTAC